MAPFHLALSNTSSSSAALRVLRGKNKNPLRVLCASVVVFFALLPCMARGDLLDPLDFASLGTLNLASGSFTIDADALTIVDDTDPNTPLFTGVADDQNGTADYLNGNWVPGSMGIPEIAVFTFDEINLESTANINVVGTRALAFLSHGSAMIDTTIDLNGQSVSSVPFGNPQPAGVGRFGGFGGGATAATNDPGAAGDGPGAGGPGTAPSNSAGGGGFGGPGVTSAPCGACGPGGSAYGDLVQGPLQGGSGGGSQPTVPNGGAAGGGALEVAAQTSLTLGPNGHLQATGGLAGEIQSNLFDDIAGGVGSGGGIRLHGQSVNLLGSVDASARRADTFDQVYGGGGRVLVLGFNSLFDFTVGLTDASSIDTSAINVEGGVQTIGQPGFPQARGLITVSPPLTTIPFGESLVFGQTTDLSDANRRLHLVHHNVRVLDGGEVVVPIEGYANHNRIELFFETARITGGGTLHNGGEINGTGTIEPPVVNGPGGAINTIGNVLTFTQSVDNADGGQINAINSTLDFQGGLTNDGELNLINTAILGSITSGSSGAASFVGDNSVGGNLTMASGDSLAIRVGGTLPGEFDTLTIGGNATVAGNLNVSLDPGFSLALGNSFLIVDVTGTTSGEFNGLADGALVGDFDGVPLFIDYYDDGVALVATLAGDFDLDFDVDGEDFLFWQIDPNDGDLSDWETNYGTVLPPPLAAASQAVPEPGGATLIALASLLLMNRRARGERGDMF